MEEKKDLSNLIDEYNSFLLKKLDSRLEVVDIKECACSSDNTIKVKCKDCGRVFEIKGNKLKKFLEAPRCESIVCRNRTKNAIMIKTISKGEYTVIKNFVSIDPESSEYKRILIKHNKCGHEYGVLPKRFIDGTRCPECTKTPFKSHEEYVSDVNHVGNGKFTVKSRYVRASKSVTIEHAEGCGKEFDVNAGYFLNDARCPLCEKATPSTKGSRKHKPVNYKSASSVKCSLKEIKK